MVWAYVPTFYLDPETPKSSVEFYNISWEKLDPDKNLFFFFFFFQVQPVLYFPISFAIFPMFSAVWCGPKSQPLI